MGVSQLLTGYSLTWIFRRLPSGWQRRWWAFREFLACGLNEPDEKSSCEVVTRKLAARDHIVNRPHAVSQQCNNSGPMVDQ